jgi:hypothetical protein
MAESGKLSLERGLGAVLVGLITAAVMVISIEPSLRRFYPVPPADGGLSAEQYQQMMTALPRQAFGLLWGLFAVASLGGGLAATLVSGRTKSWPALATGAVLLVAGTFTAMTVYQPLWFRAASFLTYPLSYLGYLAIRKR